MEEGCIYMFKLNKDLISHISTHNLELSSYVRKWDPTIIKYSTWCRIGVFIDFHFSILCNDQNHSKTSLLDRPTLPAIAIFGLCRRRSTKRTASPVFRAVADDRLSRIPVPNDVWLLLQCSTSSDMPFLTEF